MTCSSQILTTVQRQVPDGLRKVREAGYTCQTQLIQTMRAEHYQSGATYYLWFSLELNPHSVDLTSRPFHIYEDLDVAVHTRSTGHPKITGFRMKYCIEIDKWGKPKERSQLKARVATADISWFRPIILKLDLTNEDLGQYLDQCRDDAIHAGATPGEERDEYLAKAFPAAAGCVIVE